MVFAAWVPFKAGGLELDPVKGSTSAALEATRSILASMFGFHGWQGWPNAAAVEVKDSWALRSVLCIFIVWLLPNSQEIMRRYFPALGLRGLTGKDARPARAAGGNSGPPAVWVVFSCC